VDGVSGDAPGAFHELKCAPVYFAGLWDGSKMFEVRKDDRRFRVGDALWLREYWDGLYTGRSVGRGVTYILSGFPGLEAGYVVLGLHPAVFFVSKLKPDDVFREVTLAEP
jgi:hypothetical protein